MGTRLRIVGRIASEFAQQKFSSPLPANSDENDLPLDPTQAEFVGRACYVKTEIILSARNSCASDIALKKTE
jgi:hypothetical protein